jgi:hypothetical protein
LSLVFVLVKFIRVGLAGDQPCRERWKPAYKIASRGPVPDMFARSLPSCQLLHDPKKKNKTIKTDKTATDRA